MRTPITLIAGHAEGLLRRGPQPPALQLIQQEAQRMGTLVSDLLDLARNDAGRLHPRIQPLLADDVLLELHERMAPQASGRLRLQASDHAPAPPPTPTACSSASPPWWTTPCSTAMAPSLSPPAQARPANWCCT